MTFLTVLKTSQGALFSFPHWGNTGAFQHFPQQRNKPATGEEKTPGHVPTDVNKTPES